ncbi:MAG: hypothetical protein ACLR5Y_07215 [Haemophilus parainfluenzae]
MVSLEAAGSQLTAGTATLVAENVLTVRGSDLNSQDQFDLHAKQVNLEALRKFIILKYTKQVKQAVLV